MANRARTVERQNGLQERATFSWDSLAAAGFTGPKKFVPHEPSFSRDELASYLFNHLLTEWGVEAEVAEMPVSSAEVLRHLNNFKGQGLKKGDEAFFFQHGKVVRRGVVDVMKPDAVDEATALASSSQRTVEEWEQAMTRIRAAQFLSDYLGLVDEPGKPMWLKSTTVGANLVLSLVFEIAMREGRTVKHTAVPGGCFETSIALTPQQVMEALSPESVLSEDRSVEVSAFGGAAKVTYRLPYPGAIFMAIVDTKNEAIEMVKRLKGGNDEEVAELEWKIEAADRLVSAFRNLQQDTESLARETGRKIPGTRDEDDEDKADMAEKMSSEQAEHLMGLASDAHAQRALQAIHAANGNGKASKPRKSRRTPADVAE